MLMMKSNKIWRLLFISGGFISFLVSILLFLFNFFEDAINIGFILWGALFLFISFRFKNFTWYLFYGLIVFCFGFGCFLYGEVNAELFVFLSCIICLFISGLVCDFYIILYEVNYGFNGKNTVITVSLFLSVILPIISYIDMSYIAFYFLVIGVSCILILIKIM